MSSDEELSIFNRSIKSPYLENNDDKELSPETWQAALQPSNGNNDAVLPSLSIFQDGRRSSGDTTCSETSNSSSAAELQMQDPSILQIGDNIPMTGNVPNFSSPGIPTAWSQMLSALHIRNPNIRQMALQNESSRRPGEDEHEKPLFSVGQRNANRNIVRSGININNSNQEMKDSQLMEASMNLENQMVSF